MLRIHFVGINGVGMSALASLFSKSGFYVTGSDTNSEIPRIDYNSLGITLYREHSSDNVIGSQVIIRSSAVPSDNIELIEATNKGIKVIKRSQGIQLLNDVLQKRVIAIGGTNGKGNVSSLIANIFHLYNFDPIVLCGARMLNFNSYIKFGKGDFFIVESCEFDRSFLDVSAESIVVTNIENEHLDYYKGGINEIGNAFIDFVHTTDNSVNGIRIINCENIEIQSLLIEKLQGIANTELLGLPDSQWKLKLKRTKDHFQTVSVFRKNQHFDTYEIDKRIIPFPQNLLPVIIISDFYGIPKEYIKKGIITYLGLERRFQNIDTGNNNIVIYDYSSHYRTFSDSLNIIKELYPNKKIISICGFRQIHRTKNNCFQFASIFSKSDLCIILPLLKGLGDNEIDVDFDIKEISNTINSLGGNSVYPKDQLELFNLIKTLYNDTNQLFFLAGTGSTESILKFILELNNTTK